MKIKLSLKKGLLLVLTLLAVNLQAGFSSFLKNVTDKIGANKNTALGLAAAAGAVGLWLHNKTSASSVVGAVDLPVPAITPIAQTSVTMPVSGTENIANNSFNLNWTHAAIAVGVTATIAAGLWCYKQYSAAPAKQAALDLSAGIASVAVEPHIANHSKRKPLKFKPKKKIDKAMLIRNSGNSGTVARNSDPAISPAVLDLSAGIASVDVQSCKKDEVDDIKRLVTMANEIGESIEAALSKSGDAGAARAVITEMSCREDHDFSRKSCSGAGAGKSEQVAGNLNFGQEFDGYYLYPGSDIDSDSDIDTDYDIGNEGDDIGDTDDSYKSISPNYIARNIETYTLETQNCASASYFNPTKTREIILEFNQENLVTSCKFKVFDEVCKEMTMMINRMYKQPKIKRQDIIVLQVSEINSGFDGIFVNGKDIINIAQSI
jgi:hypothetical protein